MDRLTTNKKASEMGMYELAHNGCYVGADGAARYRDYSSDVDCREMIKKMMVNFGLVESDYWDDVSNEVFDDEMMENSMYGINDMQGLIALFYRNMWAMADLREKLKYFEDLEEQGLLLKLPCKVGDTVYLIDRYVNSREWYLVYGEHRVTDILLNENREPKVRISNTSGSYELSDFGKKVFLTKEETAKAWRRLNEQRE